MKLSDHIHLRDAEKCDAPILAQIVAMAIGDEHTLQNYCGTEYMSVLEELASSDSTQYSWKNAIVAYIDNIPAGAIICYDGASLETLRKETFEILKNYGIKPERISDETQPGEFYIDSIGVLPQFRSYGIGKQLIDAASQKAIQQGHTNIGLLVDFQNSNAEKLYTSIGFVRKNIVQFFGHEMWHLQKELSTDIRNTHQV